MVKKEKTKEPKKYKYEMKANGKKATGTPKIKYNKDYPNQIVERFRASQEKIFHEISYHKPSENQENLHYENLADIDSDLKGGVRAVSPKIIRQLYPTLQRRANNHDVTANTLTSKRGVQYKEFGRALEMCKDIQEAILLECSLNNIFNQGITQLLLKNNFGYKDKTEVENTGGFVLDISKLKP